MPRVPEYERQQSLRPAYRANVEAQATPDHMGAAIGRGMVGLAKGIGDIGAAYKTAKELEEKTTAQERVLDLQDWSKVVLNDPQNGFLARQGTEATTARADFDKFYLEKKQALSKGLSPMALAEFNRSASTLYQASTSRIISHQGEMLKQRVNAASERQVKALRDEAVAAGSSGDFLTPRQRIESAHAVFADHGQLTGQSPQDIHKRVSDFTSDVISQTIINLAQNDPEGALNYLERQRALLKAEDADKLAATLHEPVLNARASRESSSLLSETRAPRLVTEGLAPAQASGPHAFLHARLADPAGAERVGALPNPVAENIAAFMEDAPAAMRGRIGLSFSAQKGAKPVGLTFDGLSFDRAPAAAVDWMLENLASYNMMLFAPETENEWFDTVGPAAVRAAPLVTFIVPRGQSIAWRTTRPALSTLEDRLASIQDPDLRDRTRIFMQQRLDGDRRATRERDMTVSREAFSAAASGEATDAVARRAALAQGQETPGLLRAGPRHGGSDVFLTAGLLDLAARQGRGFAGLNLADLYGSLSERDRNSFGSIQNAIAEGDSATLQPLAAWRRMTTFADDQMARMRLTPEHAMGTTSGRDRSTTIARIKTLLHADAVELAAAGDGLNEEELRRRTLQRLMPMLLERGMGPAAV